jgi:hypothetical protein
MREYKRIIERPLLRLSRGADGRLRSTSEGSGIADIWADQKRIRLAEAIEEDKRRAQKKQARKAFFDQLKTKVRTAPSNFKRFGSSPKEVALQFTLPAFALPDIKKINVRKLSKKQLWAGSIVAIVGLLVVSYIASTPKKHDDVTANKGSGKAATQVLNSKAEKPSYSTLTPIGKDVTLLGGWHRVSPPEKDPVFAYVDKIDSVQINVSQQPLPQSFKADIAGSISKLADQFNAKEKISVDGVDAYVGTSEKGPQSVLFVKDDVLILIKSTDKLSNDQWAAYIATLRKG